MKRAVIVLLLTFFCFSTALFAQSSGLNINLDSFVKPNNFSSTINLLLSLSSISLFPFFLMSTTSFLRTVIVLSMIRQAIGTQQSPPNSVIISLSLFVTIFVMTPAWNRINETAVQPYQEGQITQSAAFEAGVKPLREFMINLTRTEDLALFMEFSQIKEIRNYDTVPLFIVIPSFIISELRTAFQIGFLLYIPFIVIDLIISNVLLSLGMFMLSPAMISLPFKILLFVLVDGWNLIVRGLILSFQV